MPSTIKPPKSRSAELHRACLIWANAQKSAASLVDLSDVVIEVRRELGAERGRHTEQEHDLRRAAVVFAGAGLDAVAKRILADVSRDLIAGELLSNPQEHPFLKRVARALSASLISGPSDDSSGRPDRLLLARLLMSGDALTEMCQQITDELVGGSFQSVERLRELCNLFGLDARSVVNVRESELRLALQARNEIVHEMDVKLQMRRSRRSRPRDETRRHVATLLEAGKALLEAADVRLSQRSPSTADAKLVW